MIAATVVLTAAVNAQSVVLEGRVVDEQGGAVAGARVHLSRTDGSAVRSLRAKASRSESSPSTNGRLISLVPTPRPSFVHDNSR